MISIASYAIKVCAVQYTRVTGMASFFFCVCFSVFLLFFFSCTFLLCILQVLELFKFSTLRLTQVTGSEISPPASASINWLIGP